jgi:hypothetical protein
MPGTVNDEQRLHQRFERQSGEWFTVTVKLLEFIGDHASVTNEYKQMMERANSVLAPVRSSAPSVVAIDRQSKPKPDQWTQVDVNVLGGLIDKSEISTAPTMRAMIHSSIGRSFLALLTYAAFQLLTQVILVRLAEITGLQLWDVSFVGINLFCYGWVWAVTYRYRNARKVVKLFVPNERQKRFAQRMADPSEKLWNIIFDLPASHK